MHDWLCINSSKQKVHKYGCYLRRTFVGDGIATVAMNESRSVRIERPVYEQEQLRKDFDYQKYKTCVWKKAAEHFRNINPKKCITTAIPALDWLAHYKWKRDFVSDVIAGITVAVMHIPQGMAYGMLGNVPPVVGIYMAFFPVIVYFFLGTSRHNSMGTFAVVCLMTGKTVLEHSHVPMARSLPINGSDEVHVTHGHVYDPVEVATAVTFTVALVQLLMFVFRLGIVSALLSETLVSGFTTGAAVHVLVSQLKDLLGLRIPRHKGMFVVVNTIASIVDELPNFNRVALIISAVTIVVSSFTNEVLKPIAAKKCIFPIPIELIAIVTGTLVSKYCNLEEIYAIRVVGELPEGLPYPKLPPFSLIPDIIVDSITIAIVSYTITLSMGLIFAHKLNYKVDANQELLAQGAGNIVGSFFSCMPFTASLSRSLIQQTVGGKTQIASLVSCSILFFVLMWIGPYFQPLPKAVLASVIVVALKGMLMQVTAVVKFWKLSKMDAVVWLVTFLSVVFVAIDVGLLIGVVMSLATIFFLSLKPYTCLLGAVPNTDLYLDTNRYKGTTQLPNIKIFHYCGGINFASRNYFKSELFRLIGFKPREEFALRKKLAKFVNTDDIVVCENNDAYIKNRKYDKIQRKLNTDLKCLILDFSALSHIDPSGISMLKSVADEFQRIDIPIYIAGCSVPVYEMMNKCDLFNGAKNSFRVFVTIHDAAQAASEIFHQDNTAFVIPAMSRL